MKRAVTDTNVLISSLFWGGKPLQVINIFVERHATLVLSEGILNELTRKLNHKKFAAEIEESSLTVEAIMTRFRNLAEIVLPANVPENVIRDPKIR